MPNKSEKPFKRPRLTSQQRAQRLQRIFFVVLAAVMIISMMISLVRW